MDMKKTSVYLSDEDRERLARLAERKGQSQARVLREALAAYDASQPDKNFQIFTMADEPLPPGVPGISHFDDPQDFQDWLDSEFQAGLDRDYEEQLSYNEKLRDERKS
jgi:ribbon-helix-helix CopG family protein